MISMFIVTAMALVGPAPAGPSPPEPEVLAVMPERIPAPHRLNPCGPIRQTTERIVSHIRQAGHAVLKRERFRSRCP